MLCGRHPLQIVLCGCIRKHERGQTGRRRGGKTEVCYISSPLIGAGWSVTSMGGGGGGGGGRRRVRDRIPKLKKWGKGEEKKQ